MGFLGFAFMCFDFLAWPIFALGCPLCASVRAIETISNSDMRNVVAYWIIFSLISLFELAFGRLIDWLPFWPYMKLLAICWLVVPHFNGACYVYECLLRPCLSVNPRVVIKYLIKPKENPSPSAKRFLAVVERYVKENGSEALEKLIDSKSKHTKPNTDVEEIKEVTNLEKKETDAVIQPKFIEPTVIKDDALVDTKSVELPQNNPTAATYLMKPKVPSIAKENAKSWEIKEKNPAVTTERPKFIEPTVAKDNALDDTKAVELTHKNPTTATNSMKRKVPSIAKENAKSWKIKEKNSERPKFIEPTIAKDDVVDDTNALELPQKNPTTATNSFKPKVPNIAKENAKSWKIKEKNPAATTERVNCVDSNFTQIEKKTVGVREIKEKTVAASGGENKVPEIRASERVDLCFMSSEKDLDYHLQGKKHKAKCEELKASK